MTDHDSRPVWKSDDTAVLDDSVANLLKQMVFAVAGMFVAFLLANWAEQTWLGGSDGWSSLLIRGLIFAFAGSAAIYVTSARPIRSALLTQQNAIAAHELAVEEQNRRHVMAARLQAAFEMAETDQDSFRVVSDALAESCEGPAELLLADSSRAHMRRMASAGPDDPGCDVATPWSCPAVRRSRTMTFSDSNDLDACPKLRNRGGNGCSALCVPVTVLGTPMGVLHTTSSIEQPVSDRTRTATEILAEQAGSRIGILRAMAASELQATTDPLTGLLNRRSLEAELSNLWRHQSDVTIAFIDLDHFKDLNDTFGHETGDRALRSFARLLRSTAREHDLLCRYGGEEFVLAFPDTVTSEAEAIVQRLAIQLAEAVAGGDVPPFTISVGLADSMSSTNPAEVIRMADEAMFRAKQSGRDRIIRAGLNAG